MADDAGGWSTIESDEGLFTSLIEELGVKNVQFEELVSLDADTIRSLNTVYGVIFLFKWTSGQTRNDRAPHDGTYDRSVADNHGLFFAAQTIQNACGTQAILSVILNQDTRIDIGPELRDFKDFTTGFPADLRGEALSNSAPIRNAHNSFARASPFADETARAPAGADDDAELYHFIAYTPFNGVLYELDGLQPSPISHGPCDAASFPERVIEVLQRRVARYPEGEIRFNLMAVVEDPRARAAEMNDELKLQSEENKRRAWAWENALRRWNFVGFIGEILKGVVGMKVAGGQDEYEKWVKEARQETTKKLNMRRTGGAGE